MTSEPFSSVGFAWISCLAGCLLAYGLSLLVRAREIDLWQHPALKLDGQYIMSTHDAYAWLAGAVGVNGFFVDQPLPEMLCAVHFLTGLSIAHIGFWLPALLAPVAAVPVCFLACWLGGREYAAAAGLLAATSLSYTVRTRLGSLDTDLYTLLFPVVLAGALVLWLDTYFSMAWRLSGRQREAGENTAFTDTPSTDRLPVIWGGAALLGLLCQLYYHFYASGMAIMLVTLGMGGVVGFALAAPGLRLTALCAASLATVPLFFGWPGMILATAVAAAVWKRPDLFANHRVLLGILGGTALAVLLFAPDILRGMLSHVLTWLKPTHVAGGVDDTAKAVLQLPGIRQSVREAQNAPLSLIIEQIAGHWSVFWAGAVGYVYLCWRRPACLAFLPLLLLGLAGTRFGYRFSMYGGPTIGLGFLGLGLAANRYLRLSSVLRWVAGGVLVVGVAYPLFVFSSQLRPSPVLTREFARTLRAADNSTATDGWLWQWWDYGYAAQFYGKRYTFADGGRNYSNWVFPLAKVHTARSPMAAAQLMHEFAATSWRQVLHPSQKNRKDHPEVEDWTEKRRMPGIFDMSLNPIENLQDMGAENAQKYLDNLATRPMKVSSDHPPQYFAVGWDNLKISAWISDFGSWNVVTGSHTRGQVGRIGGDVSIDTAQGVLTSGQYPPLRIKELCLVRPDENKFRHWPNPDGLYAVVNRMSNEVYLMDAWVYESMMIQMLLKDPAEFAPYFELVVENQPWGRIYRLAR
jgi:dolichyl-diphosphooligosaccharide--protein glycosyltransferase